MAASASASTRTSRTASANRALRSNVPRRSRRAPSTRSALAAAKRRPARGPQPATSPPAGATACVPANTGHAAAPANSSTKRRAASASKAARPWTRRSCKEPSIAASD